jgi:hypothetical protein
MEVFENEELIKKLKNLKDKVLILCKDFKVYKK